MDFVWSNIHFNDGIIKILTFNMAQHDVPFLSSQVLWRGDLLWLLDDVTSETAAGGRDGMIFWREGLIFLFILSHFLSPLKGQCDFHSPDILKNAGKC